MNLLQAQQDRPVRIINFAGMDWYVRSGTGNPANNLWSDSEKSVWVDNQNRLHLKIRKVGNRWYAAEIRSVHPTTYGQHRFYVANRVDLLDRNIVAAVFIYKDNKHEMDIEFSRWKQKQAPNTQYVVQPELPENLYKFDLKLQGNFSTHIINWQKKQIEFESYFGHKIALPQAQYLINQWTYQQKSLTDDKQYRIHINLWMVDNQPPVNNQEAELIIASMDSPVSPISISGKATPLISLYPNHYYDHIFVYIHQTSADIKYKLLQNNKILEQEDIQTDYFFIDLVNKSIGKYDLQIQINKQVFRYEITKNY